MCLNSLPFFFPKVGWCQRPSVSRSAETCRHWENRILICSVNYNLNVCFKHLNSYYSGILSAVIFCLFVYLRSECYAISQSNEAWHSVASTGTFSDLLRITKSQISSEWRNLVWCETSLRRRTSLAVGKECSTAAPHSCSRCAHTWCHTSSLSWTILKAQVINLWLKKQCI